MSNFYEEIYCDTEQVICINNKPFNAELCLTVGKIYQFNAYRVGTTLNVKNEQIEILTYKIRNDININIFYDEKLFKKINDHREEQLNKLFDEVK